MNYYKILNKEECHNNLQYKTGLNTLLPDEKWNPAGYCQPGGIYFAREDILAFLHYGCWIRQVTIPADARIHENSLGLYDPVKWKADKVILGKRRKITLKVIKGLVEEGANIHANRDIVFIKAAAQGNLALVKYLVSKGARIHTRNEAALRNAIFNRCWSVVEYLKSLVPQPKKEDT